MKKEELEEYKNSLPYETRERITRLYTETNMNVKDIIEQENLKVLPAQLHCILNPRQLEKKCKYCNINFIEYPTRTGSPDPFCPNCNHREKGAWCTCPNCEAERKIKQEEKRKREQELAVIKKKKIQDIWYSNREPVKFEDLTLKQKIEVGTLVNWNQSEDLGMIHAISEIREPVTPSGLKDADLIQDLIRDDIIKVDIESDINSFSDDGKAITKVRNVRFFFNIDLGQYNLEDIYMGNFPKDENEIIELWKQLYVTEAIEYMLFRLELAGLSFNPGEKTKTVFSDISKDFSFGQLMQMIYSTYKTAITRIQEGSYTRKHAINTMITMIDHYATNVRNGIWNCSSYSRDKRIPRSALSLYFYDKILGLGDLAYELPVCKQSINSGL